MAGHFVTPTTLIPQILIGSLQLGLDYYCERKIQSSPRGGGAMCISSNVYRKSLQASSEASCTD